MLNRNVFRTAMIAIILCYITGCASSPPAAAPSSSAAVSTPKPTLRQFTHADAQTAMAYATAHGHPERAAVIQAWEGVLTAKEAQGAACKAAIAAAVPAPPPAGSTVGVLTLGEIAAEAIGTGIPANVQITCEDIVVPLGMLPLPKL